MGRLHCIPLRNAIRTPRATTLRASNGRDQQHVKPALPSRTLLSKAAQQSLNSEPGCIKVVDTFRNGKYVRTHADGYYNDNLLALVECVAA